MSQGKINMGWGCGKLSGRAGGDSFSPTAAFREALVPPVFQQIPLRPIACQRPPIANEQRVVGSTGGVRTGPTTRLRSSRRSRAGTGAESYLLIFDRTHYNVSNRTSGCIAIEERPYIQVYDLTLNTGPSRLRNACEARLGLGRASTLTGPSIPLRAAQTPVGLLLSG